MVVKLAKTAGFCKGVRRALDIILSLSKIPNQNIYTWGSLIHNNLILEMLREKGVTVADQNNIDPDATVIIRAHGVTPETRNYLQDTYKRVCDATCPDVGAVHAIVKKYSRQGYFTVIVGDKGHAEVAGIKGYATENRQCRVPNHCVVETEADIAALPKGIAKICVVAQTTQSREDYRIITDRIRKLYPDAVIHDTICDSTAERQQETLELAREMDLMIVVGSRSSANTTRLVDISRSTGTPTFLVESVADLDSVPVNEHENIGVTAGASAPNWLITLIVDELKRMKMKKKNVVIRLSNLFMRFCLISNLYIAGGAMGLSFTSCLIQDISPKNPKWIIYPLIAFFYIQAVHLLNYFTDTIVTKYHNPLRINFHARYKKPLIIAGIISSLIAILLSFSLNMFSGILILLLSLLGIMYNVTLLPDWISKYLIFKKIKDLPGSKDFLFAFGWALITVLLFPLSATPFVLSYKTVLYFIFVFTIVFSRSVFFDIRELQGDIIIGSEALPVLIGKNNSKILLVVMNAALLVLLLSSGYGLLMWLSLVVLYTYLYLFLYHKRIIFQDVLCEFIADATFIMVGIIGYIYYLL